MKLAPLLAAACLLCACNYQVYVNGHLSLKASRTRSEWLKKNDSFLVVSPSQKLPDSAILIERAAVSHTSGLASIERLRQRRVDQLKPEAKKAGANLIRETIGTISPDIFAANLYLLKEPYKTHYARQLDSIRLSHRDSCIVHIRDFALCSNCVLYFKGAMIGYCRFPTRSGRPDALESSTYTFWGSGRLTFTDEPCRVAGRGISLRKGKEYYLLIDHSKYGAIIQVEKIYDF